MSNNTINLKLTVAIPNYNGGCYLESAIRSCIHVPLARTEFEILVVDNQSEDDSRDIVTSLQAEYPNLRLEINQENIGRLSNWERCIQLAKGKYFQYLFVTDQFLPGNELDRLMNSLDNDPSVAMYVSTFLKYKHKDQAAIGNRYILGLERAESSDFIRTRLIDGHLNQGLLANLMRTEDISTSHFDPRHPFSADHIFSAEVSLKRQYLCFEDTPRFAWNIYLNPNRFHANTALEQIVKDRLGAAEVLSSMVDLPLSRLHRFYMGEFSRVLRYWSEGNNLISKNSNTIIALRHLFHTVQKSGTGRTRFYFHLICRVLRRIPEIVKRKIPKRRVYL